jgi:hypothetical protein
MRENRLYASDSPIMELIQIVRRTKVDDSSELTFEDDNNISVFTPINGGTVKWQRVPNQ